MTARADWIVCSLTPTEEGPARKAVWSPTSGPWSRRLAPAAPELFAAAIASALADALMDVLHEHDSNPVRLDVTCTVEQGPLRVSRVRLDVLGNVPGTDETAFAALTDDARGACVLLTALAGDVEIELRSELASEQLAAAAGP